MSKTLLRRRRGRPPKELAGTSATRDALVRAGVVMLTEKGYSATGIEEVLQSVDVPKGSFYHYFPSKEAFGAELIDSYAGYFSRKLDGFFLNEQHPPLERLRGFTDDATSAMKRFRYARGCLVGNLGQEMSVLPQSFRQQLFDVFIDWQQRTAKCLRATQAAGAISSNQDCDWLAEFFWIGWEGAVLRAKLERRSDPLHSFSKGFFKLVGE
ncbi:TetR/AcrR family transcriptional regulator [Bradyrhizobium sp. 41S5]|uniref:acrylate utilization transcriptional regulator AcuR n=1 Tax=Bradyrhizobium sp. 41S5 TaxID=1404443 RepID=UPI00156B8141|nr:TetR/AcrR family transcriptional regulator [Bradyrhizobium sp. 41S5]UFX42862.1 TetR/AcrR family transcriptional regulator [Bradyrhizobium sp. 41S5]